MKKYLFFKSLTLKSKTGLDKLKNEDSKNKETLKKLLCEYVSCRFMLNRIPSLDENLNDLAKESLALMQSLPTSKLMAMEEASGCTGAKSYSVKKVLLCMSIAKAFDTEMSESELSSIDLLKDLLAFVIKIKR